MRYRIEIACGIVILAASLLVAAAGATWAQANGQDWQAAVQALGSRTRTMITSASDRGSDVDQALRFQSLGDEALRDGELVRAAEEYGRAEELLLVLEHERIEAKDDRYRTMRDIDHARREGFDVANADLAEQKGDRALDNGQFVDAEVYYAQARADVNSQRAGD
jgi:hypothetical protein